MFAGLKLDVLSLSLQSAFLMVFSRTQILILPDHKKWISVEGSAGTWQSSFGFRHEIFLSLYILGQDVYEWSILENSAAIYVVENLCLYNLPGELMFQHYTSVTSEKGWVQTCQNK